MNTRFCSRPVVVSRSGCSSVSEAMANDLPYSTTVERKILFPNGESRQREEWHETANKGKWQCRQQWHNRRVGDDRIAHLRFCDDHQHCTHTFVVSIAEDLIGPDPLGLIFAFALMWLPPISVLPRICGLRKHCTHCTAHTHRAHSRGRAGLHVRLAQSEFRRTACILWCIPFR